VSNFDQFIAGQNIASPIDLEKHPQFKCAILNRYQELWMGEFRKSE
jgi:hypothetical protein